jgi:hypothetical protein
LRSGIRSEAVLKDTFNNQILNKIRHLVPIDRSILLSSFSKEELLDYDLARDAIKAFSKSLLEKRDLGRLILP